MKDAQSSDAVVSFGAYEVDFQSRKLRKHGMRVRLEEQPFQILEMLLHRAGQVVPENSLGENLGPNTMVVNKHSLNPAVNKLRELLGASAQSPRFIEPVPRVGSRFTAPVTKLQRSSSPAERKML